MKPYDSGEIMTKPPKPLCWETQNMLNEKFSSVKLGP